MKNLSMPMIVLFALYIGGVNAQEKNQLNFMNEQLSEQLYNQTIVLSEPKLVKAQAELFRKNYEALIQSGFSKDEALQIVVAMASQHKPE